MVICFLATGESETSKQRSDRILLDLLDHADRNYLDNLRRRRRCYHRPVSDSIAAFINSSPPTHMGLGMGPLGLAMQTPDLWKYLSAHPFCSACGRTMGPRDLTNVLVGDGDMRSHRCSSCSPHSWLFHSPAFSDSFGPSLANVLENRGLGGYNSLPNFSAALGCHNPFDLTLPGAIEGLPSLGMTSLDTIELMQRRMWEQGRLEADRLRMQALDSQEELKQRRWVESNWRQLAQLNGLLGGSGAFGSSGNLMSGGGLGALDGLGGPGGIGDLLGLGKFGGAKGMPFGLPGHHQMTPPMTPDNFADSEHPRIPRNLRNFDFDMFPRRRLRHHRRRPGYSSSELADDLIFPRPGRRRKLHRWTNNHGGRNSILDALDKSDSSSEESDSNDDHHITSSFPREQMPRHSKRHRRGECDDMGLGEGFSGMPKFGIPSDFEMPMPPGRRGVHRRSSRGKKRESG